jgi:thiamine-phosphate diphosphorylase
MTVCYVTDRKVFRVSAGQQIRLLLEKMESAACAGVDWIQIREKDLSGRELSALTGEALRRIPRSCRILVNDRLDVAMAVGAGGVHLGEQSLPVEEAKRLAREKNLGPDFLIGASAHSLETVEAAEKSGADYAIFGPVYETASKISLGAAQGVERLAAVSKGVAIPVIAIGGITTENARECLAVAAGIAAIRLFQDTSDLAALLRRLRE